jgi:hypothetical protein
MQDQPTAFELLDAVTQFLNTEIAPTLNDPRLKFRALVAANVLTIVRRELELGDAQQHAELERLRALFPSRTADADVTTLTQVLAQTIRAGDADEGAFHDAVMAHVEQTVIEKLQVANPKYLERLKQS